MSDYVKINPNSKHGELMISRQIFETIATDAVNKVNSNKKDFKLAKDVQAIFQKNGRVKVLISIELKKGVNAHEVSLKIQEDVTSALMAYVESVPFDVQINIAEVK